MKSFLRDLVGREKFTIQPMPGDARNYRLHRNGETILFDYASLDDYGSVTLYVNGMMVANVRASLISDLEDVTVVR